MSMILRSVFQDLKEFDRVYDYLFRINHMITNKAQKRLEIIVFNNIKGYNIELMK